MFRMTSLKKVLLPEGACPRQADNGQCMFTPLRERRHCSIQEVVGASKNALSRNVGNDITALCVFTGNSCVITEESIFTSRLERRHCSMRARWK